MSGELARKHMPDVPALAAISAVNLDPGMVLHGWLKDTPPQKGWYLIEQPVRVLETRIPGPTTLLIKGISTMTGKPVEAFDIDLFTRVLVAFRPLDGHCPTCGHNGGACDGRQ